MRKGKSRKKCTLKLKIIQIIFWNGKIHLNATEWNVVWMTYDTFHWYLARIEAARVCVHVWNISGYYVQLTHRTWITSSFWWGNGIVWLKFQNHSDVTQYDTVSTCSLFSLLEAYTRTPTSFKIMSLLAFTLRLMRDQLNANIIIFLCVLDSNIIKNTKHI